KARRRLEAVYRGGAASRSLRIVPDRARHHAARPRAAFRYPLLYCGRFRDHPSRRGRDPSRRRTRRTGLGGDRLEAARRPASDDQERAGRAGKTPRHRSPASRRSRPVLPFLRRQDAQGCAGRSETGDEGGVIAMMRLTPWLASVALCLGLSLALPAQAHAELDVAKLKTAIETSVEADYPKLDALYKDIHAHPELAF